MGGRAPGSDTMTSRPTPNNAAYRYDLLWAVSFVHRVSGILLACFLPLHFLVLGLAIEGEARLGGFLTWTQHPLVKVAEAALIFVLAVHLLGGLRILAVEFGSWRPGQRAIARVSILVAAGVALIFLLRVL